MEKQGQVVWAKFKTVASSDRGEKNFQAIVFSDLQDPNPLNVILDNIKFHQNIRIKRNVSSIIVCTPSKNSHIKQMQARVVATIFHILPSR